MAEVILEIVAGKAVEITSDTVFQEVSRLSRQKEFINWILNEMRYIQSYLEDADAKIDNDQRVATLLKDITSLGWDAEDILDLYFPKIVLAKRKGFVGCLRYALGIFNHLYSAHKFAVEVEGLKRRVDEINTRRLTYGIQETSNISGGSTNSPRITFPHVEEPNVIGFDPHIQVLVAKLLDGDQQCKFVSITGMPGLGKTTLAKKVYNSVSREFESAAWIYVSQQPNPMELLRHIARQVGLEKEKWEYDVETNLFGFLSKKRYVIVIDDIWTTEPWNVLKNGIPINSQNGSRVILTSRNTDVGLHIGGQNSLYDLMPLDNENSRKLFVKMVRGIDSIDIGEMGDPPGLAAIGEQIITRCDGVPLALVLTAGMLALRERSEQAWNRVLRKMGTVEDKYSRIFALSYKDLPTKMKPCFLYFGLFPEDYEIRAFDLIAMWEVEGLIRGDGERDATEVGEEYLDNLIARNLIQVGRRRCDGRIKSLRIHDILHDLCVNMAKDINFFNNVAEVNSAGATGVRRITAHNINLKEYLSLDYETPKLRSFLSFNAGVVELECMEKFLKGLKILKVLNLEVFVIVKFPSDNGNLTSLSYIRLHNQIGHNIYLPSSVCKLRSLQTLDLRGGPMSILPDCIWKMNQLKHILGNLRIREVSYKITSRCGPNKRAPPEEVSLENLQTLYTLDACDVPDHYSPKFPNMRKLGLRFDGGDELLKVKKMLDAVVLPEQLEVLKLTTPRVSIRARTFHLQELNLSRFENLRHLKLNLATGASSLGDALPKNITKITLGPDHLIEAPLECLKKLPVLKILKLRVSPVMVVKELVCSGGPDSFPQLQVLQLQIRYFNKLILEEQVMPRLNKLRILGSPRLISIPDRIKNVMEEGVY